MVTLILAFQVSYYCTQRHLKEMTSRSSSNAKNRHSSQDEQQSNSEAALITPDVESVDDRIFDTPASSSVEVSEQLIGRLAHLQYPTVLQAPLCHNNRVSPLHEKTKRASKNNNYPTLSNTLLNAELVSIDLDVLRSTGVDQRLNKDLLLNGCATVST